MRWFSNAFSSKSYSDLGLKEDGLSLVSTGGSVFFVEINQMVSISRRWTIFMRRQTIFIRRQTIIIRRQTIKSFK